MALAKFLPLLTAILFLFSLTGSNSVEGGGKDTAIPSNKSIAPLSLALDESSAQSPFRPQSLRRKQMRIGNAYSITMAEEALKIEQIPKMVEGHPRLLLRRESWKYGLSLAQLHERAKKEPWATQISKDMRKPPDHPAGGTGQRITHRALLYLITGDESLVPRIVERIMSVKPRYNTGGGLVQTALWYDWIFNSPSVSNEQRREMADKIAEVALECARIFESGHAFDIWTHRGSPGWASDVLAAGLVLDDHPEAEKLRAWGMGYFKKNYFRGWQHNDGSWMHGGSAYNIGMIMPRIIAYWASAVEGEDIYKIIQEDYGSWLEGHLWYMMSEVLPDKTRSDAVAWDYNPPGLRLKQAFFYWPIAKAYQIPEFYVIQRWLGEDPKCGFYGRLMRILFYDKDIDAMAMKTKLNEPFSRLWGRHGPGYVQIRSAGWAPHSTVIEYKCGDLVWTHSQANHNNSFWIFHKGRLAIQGGAYGLDKCWHGGTGSHYFTQSISSNTMLVFQPGEFTHAGGDRAGELVAPGHILNPGGQRMRWAFGQTCFTFDEYLRRKTEESNIQAGLFETGNIIAFEKDPEYHYSYVSGDATMAYNNPIFCYGFSDKKNGESRRNKPKIDLFTRSMAYLTNSNNLIIFDRVQSMDASWRKAWLCHFQGKPELVNGNPIRVDVPGHIEDFDGDTIRMTWADGVLQPPDPKDPGRLFIKTVLPEKHFIRRIGGDGYEAWWNGKNRTGDDKKKLIDRLDAGRWRVEVSPSEARKFDNFLHVIHICDTETDKMPPVQRIDSKGRKMVGVSAGRWVVMFGRLGEVEGEISYFAPQTNVDHLIVDLIRDQRYIVEDTAGGTKIVMSSSEGTLRISTGPSGNIRIKPL